MKGYCKAASIELDYVYPVPYAGLLEVEDDFNSEQPFTGLKVEWEAQLKEEAALNKHILENLSEINASDE